MVTTIDAVIALGDAAAACYGDSLDWAALLSGSRGGEVQWLPVRISPSLGSCAGTQMSPDCVLHPGASRWISVVGHFNDPASATCTATVRPGFDPAPPAITPAGSEADHRTRFVLDSFTELHATGDMPAVDPRSAR